MPPRWRRGVALLKWATLTDEVLAQCARDMDVEEGYEDFIELQAHPRWRIAERDANLEAVLLPVLRAIRIEPA